MKHILIQRLKFNQQEQEKISYQLAATPTFWSAVIHPTQFALYCKLQL